MFRQYSGSGSFGGRVWGPRCIFFAYSRTAIWALFAKQEGHQIASTITTCTRTNEEPCIPGPLCSCTDRDLFGTLLPAGRSNFGGSPGAQSLLLAYRSHRHRNLARPARRSLPIRPYLHARITRITSVEQLPQIRKKGLILRLILGLILRMVVRKIPKNIFFEKN